MLSLKCQEMIETVIILIVSSKEFSVARVNTLRLRQNGRHFADGNVIFKCISLNETFEF